MEIGSLRLHELARVEMLSTRRDIQLLNLMFSLKQNCMQNDSARVTRNAGRFEFKTEIVHKDIYSKFPFYKGVCLWNDIPIEHQNLTDSKLFKNITKKHFSTF